MSYTSNNTWISDMINEFGRFVRISKEFVFIAPKSPNVPQGYSEWLEHRVFIIQRAQEAVSRHRTLRASQPANQAKTSIQPFGGKRFKDSRSSVLAMETIWLPPTSLPLQRPVAPWPCSDELTSEGTLRSMSGHSRFPPLPRVPANETVHWRKRAPIKPYPFDTFGSPSLGHIAGGPDTEDEMAFFVGQALLEEIDLDQL